MGSLIKLKNADRFGKSFLEEFLARGMGSMQKRDIDILVFDLLIKDAGPEDEINFFSLSRTLRISETRLRNMHYESQLRYGSYSELEALEEFIEVIEKGHFEQGPNETLIFIIRNPMLRQFFEEWVAANDGFTDSSFNKSLVKVSSSLLIDILCQLVSDESRALDLASHFMEDKEGSFDLRKVVKTYVKKFLLKKIDKGAEYGLGYAALLLKQLLLPS